MNLKNIYINDWMMVVFNTVKQLIHRRTANVT